jgi:hypothetical protein
MSPRRLPDIACKLNYWWTGSVGYRGRLRKLRGDAPRCDRPDLTGCEAERLTTRDIAGTRPELPHSNAVISNKVLFMAHIARNKDL